MAGWGVDTNKGSMARRRTRQRVLGLHDEPKRFGRYLLMGELGEGGMSIVYDAHDPELDRRVALKVLNSHYRAKDHSRLTREGIALARANHPSIVKVYETGEVNGQLYLALEYIDGKPFNQWMESRPSADEILATLIPLLTGLATVHGLSEGLVHRDIKPSNILVTAAGTGRLIDFGIAKKLEVGTTHASSTSVESVLEGAADSVFTTAGVGLAQDDPRTATYSGTRTRWAGTCAYMSPEQIRGRPLDGRSDLFSFCIVLWEAVFGEHPFPQAEIERERNLGELRTPRVDTWLKRLLRQTLRRGLAKEPGDRFQTAAELQSALVRVQSFRLRALKYLGFGGFALVLLARFVVPSAAEKECRSRGTAWMRSLSNAVELRDAALVDRVDTFVSTWRRTWDETCSSTEESSEAQRLCLEGQAEIIRLALGARPADVDEATWTARLLRAEFPAPAECTVPSAYVLVNGRPHIREGEGARLRARVGEAELTGDAEVIVASAKELVCYYKTMCAGGDVSVCEGASVPLNGDCNELGLLADAQYELARLSRRYTDVSPKVLLDDFREAETNGIASRNLWAAALSAQEAARVAILDLEDPEAGSQAASRSHAFVALLGDAVEGTPWNLRARQHNIEGTLRFLQGKPLVAMSSHERALTTLGRPHSPGMCPWSDGEKFLEAPEQWFEVARSLHNWGRARSEVDERVAPDGIAGLHSLKALRCAREVFGRLYRADHPEVIETLMVEAEVYAAHEDWETAILRASEALEAAESSGSNLLVARALLASSSYHNQVADRLELERREAKEERPASERELKERSESVRQAKAAEAIYRALKRHEETVDARRLQIAALDDGPRAVAVVALIHELRERGMTTKCAEVQVDGIQYKIRAVPECEPSATGTAESRPSQRRDHREPPDAPLLE